MERYLKLQEEPIKKLLIEFSLPAIVGMLVNALYNIVDRIYIGHIKEIGALAISGVGVVFPVMIASLGFALLIGLGGATNISLLLGRGKVKEAEKYLGNMSVLSILIGSILSFLVIFFMDSYIEILGASSNTVKFATDYLRIVAFGFPIFILGYALNAGIRSDGNPKTAMITLILGAITNIILDPILIFKFNLGVKGAGIATVASQTVSALWTISYFTSKHSNLKLSLENVRLNLKKAKSILTIGAGPFILQIASSFVTFLFNNLLLKYGGDFQVGAMIIVNSVNSIILMPIFGINQGLQPILGFNYGAKLYSRVRDGYLQGIKYATCISVTGFILVYTATTPIIKIFTKKPELISTTYNGMKIFCLILPFIGFQAVSVIYFQAVGKPKMTIFLSMIRQVIFLIPFVLILSKNFGVLGIWVAVPCSDFFSVIITALLVKKEMKNLKKIELSKFFEVEK